MTSLAHGCEHPLLDHHDAVFFDLDGVLYIGPDAVVGASAAVAAVRTAGLAVAFVTNNASRPPETVADHLVRLGIPAAPSDVVTSAQAVATLVASTVPAGSRVLVVGGVGLHEAVRERGLVPVDTAAPLPAAVVQGLGPEVGWRLLAEGTYAVRAGVPWFASNLDSTVPTPRGLAPGNGALVSVIAQVTGVRPVVAGKPETPLHAEAVRRTGSSCPLVVGDRLDTDIAGAGRAAAASLLVLTGVTGGADLIQAPPGQRPTYVAADLARGLLAPHPPVETTETGDHHCGGWTCRLSGGKAELRGAGDPVEALRAVCVAAWTSGTTVDEQEVDRLLAAAGW